MENPNTASGIGASRVTSRATVVRELDDTRSHDLASPNEARFFWDRRSNSIERLSLHLGEGLA